MKQYDKVMDAVHAADIADLSQTGARNAEHKALLIRAANEDSAADKLTKDYIKKWHREP